MSTISLKKDSKVFYNNEEYKIIQIINFNKVAITNIQTNDIINVSLNELSSSHTTIKEKSYIEDYSEQEWTQAKKRYQIIKNLVFIKRTKDDVEKIAKENNYSSVTLYGWIKLYEQTEEISSLIPNTSQRGKKGGRLDPHIENIISLILDEYFLNKQRYSFKRIYNKIYKQCKENKLTPPHENTIRNRIDALDQKLVIKKRHGYKEANKQFENYEGEFPEGNYPLDFIQIDHTPLDIRVVDKVHRKPIGKPYLTLAIDVYSRMIAGVYLSLQAPGYYNVSQCLFNIFSQKDNLLKKHKVDGEWNIFGIPRIIGVDNGADLVSTDMQRVCDEYGITLMKRPVARPQYGAHVERVLGTINKEVHNLSGTTFSNITEKGTYNSDKEAMFTLEELTQWLLHYIVNIYHKKKHAGIETSPNEKYLVGIFGDEDNVGTGQLPSIIENIEDVEISLFPTEFRTVQRDGITLDGISYYSDVLRHWIGRRDSKKSKIKHKIKRDPLNIQKIYFYDSELKEYFEIPYRKLSAPVMTLWDLYAVKRHLKEKNISNYTEDDIFDAYIVLENIEANTKSNHKKVKGKKSISASKMNELKKVDKHTLASEHFDSLFEDIELYDITSGGTENE
jgi:putative transposase